MCIFNGPVCCVLNRCHNTRPVAMGATAENQTAETVRQWKIDLIGPALIIRYLDTLKIAFKQAFVNLLYKQGASELLSC